LSVVPAFLPPSSEELALLAPEIERWLTAGDPALPLVCLTAYQVLPRTFESRDIYGIALATRAVERLVDRGSAFRLVLLLSEPPRGPAERAYLERHEDVLRRRLGERYRRFCGAYAPPVLARSCAFLRPSLADGDSVALREALALGVTVVASDAVPRPPGVLLHASGDVDGLARQLALALRRPERSPAHRDADPVEPLERIYRSLGGSTARSHAHA
jgi:glycosyltransferase involved in cell wall biosynthesis